MLGKTFTQAALAALCRDRRGELEPLLAGARAQGGARAAVRPALAGARPVRLPPGPRPPCRLRDAPEARAPARSISPPPSTSAPRWRGRGRRGRRLALARRVPSSTRTPTTRRELRAKARAALVRAGERAASLGAPAEAQRYFEQAAELADEPPEQARRSAAPVRWRWPGRDRARGIAVRAGRALYERPATRTRPRAPRAGSLWSNSVWDATRRRSSGWTRLRRRSPGRARRRPRAFCSSGSACPLVRGKPRAGGRS